MGKQKKIRFYIIAVFAILIIVLLAYIFINQNEEARKDEARYNFKLLSELKITQVSEWFQEKKDGAITIQKNPNYEVVNEYLKNPNRTKLGEKITEWLLSIKNQYEFDDIWLLDREYKVKLSSNDEIIPEIEKQVLKQLIQDKQIFFSDLYKAQNKPGLFLEIIIPMLTDENSVYGFLTFRNNVIKGLFETINYSPVKIISAETILFKVENDSIIFIRDWNFKNNISFDFTIPYNDTNFWGSKKLSNNSGVVEASDYRGEKIFAFIKKIPNTNWYIKYKIDNAELFEPLNRETRAYVIIFILMSSFFALFTYQLWKVKNIHHLEKIFNLEKERNRLQIVYDQVVKNANDNIFILDNKLRIIEVNDKAVETYGYSRNEFLSLSVPDVRKDDNIGKMFENYKLTKKKKGLVILTTHRKKDGTYFPVEASLSYFDSEGEDYFISIVRDITERVEAENKIKQDIINSKMLQEELKQQRDKAEEMNRVKSYFFNNMSHELRTPMVGILGYLELLLQDNLSPDQREMLTAVFQSSRRLHSTLNSILEISKIESSEIKIAYNKINLFDIFKECVSLYLPIAQEKNLFIKINENVNNDFNFISDETLIFKIISNLISNGIKYTEKGGIYLNSYRKNENIIIEVQDTGIGIEDKYKGIIFEPFRQISEGFSRSYEGTGLGLSIVKNCVDLLGGTISIESKPELGSKFKIVFPEDINKVELKNLREKNQTIHYSQKTIRYTDKSILLVEDEAINSLYIKKLLGNESKIEIVNSGKEAIIKCKENKYDLILMDIGLKGKINGIDAAKAIKKETANPITPIIALTAYVMPEDKKKILEAGFDDYLGKPFEQNDFFNMIDKHLSG